MKSSKILKDWNLFEKFLLIGSISVITIVFLIFNTDLITAITSLTGIITALLLAKGKVAGQFFGLMIVVLYSFVSFQNKYYGEMLIYIFIMLPLYILGIYSWIKNKNPKTEVVEPNDISKKEWILIIFISIIFFIIFYYLLKYFKTEELFLSVLSIIGSMYAVYLLARRSKYGFLFYLFDDIILFLMWLIPVLNGNILVLPMVFNPLINFINDSYGWYRWNKSIKQT